LRRVLSAYFDYHHHSRTQLSLSKDCPEPRPLQPPSAGTVSHSHRLADCIIATNVEQLEPFAVTEPVPPSGCRASSSQSAIASLRCRRAQSSCKEDRVSNVNRSVDNRITENHRSRSSSENRFVARWIFEQRQAAQWRKMAEEAAVGSLLHRRATPLGSDGSPDSAVVRRDR
jgi:hypothetical protein